MSVWSFSKEYSTCVPAGVGVELTKCRPETNGKTVVTVECPSGLADTPTKEQEMKCRGKSTGKRLNLISCFCNVIITVWIVSLCC